MIISATSMQGRPEALGPACPACLEARLLALAAPLISIMI